MAHKWDPICAPPKGLVRPVRVDCDGVLGPTRGQAQGPRFRWVARGWYVAVDAPDVPEQRIVEQSVRLPPEGAVTGWASLRLRRGNFFDGLAPDGSTRLPVPLAVGPRSKIRTDDRVAISREPLCPDEVTVLHGVPCTVEERAVFDEMRRLRDVREATVVMDMAAAARITSVSRVRAYRESRRRWRRAGLVAEALDLADENSRSPQETRVRLIWVLEAGLAPPLVNQPVWDRRGNLLGIVDLLDEEAGLVGEFDGADHRRATRHTHDIGRQERLERHGLRVFRVTGLDVLDPRRVVDRIHFHRSRAAWLPPERRPWTLVPPEDWVPDLPLDDLLDERDFRLRLRAAQARRRG